jgi:hypothetical protein
MLCAHPHQGRYIVISLPPTSRKAVQLACWSSAGNCTAYPITCLNPRSSLLIALLQRARARPSTYITPTSPRQSLLFPISATVDAPKSP